MSLNREKIFFSVAICAVILILSLRSLLMLEFHRLGKEVSGELKEELYKDFIDTFVEEIDRILEKIEKETIQKVKNHERTNSSQEVEKWSKSIQGRKVTITMFPVT